ncbi:hypothetical protein ACJIZ3_017124 [Penstemon smallii]|uniref:Uncharacterized protein n=1 Tax=Penstemon smallii TaxID=265156 RepID=A0ABD3SVZ0_9LAMI
MMAKANGLGLFFKNEEQAYLTEPYTYQSLHQALLFCLRNILSLMLSSFQGHLLYINMDACIQKILDTWMMGVSLFTVLKSSSNRKVFRNLFKWRQDKHKV